MAASIFTRSTRFFTTGGSLAFTKEMRKVIYSKVTLTKVETLAKEIIPFKDFQKIHVGSFSKYKEEMGPLFPTATDEKLRDMFNAHSRSMYKRYINSNTSNPALIQ